ncbi:MAG TPA: Gfo/Idh/MocA family oxidoreductase [Ignavibacteria bacterium]|nr:Gfo/Idh/MocA family oxidoreductase [Ignavibacteria bacterium]HMR38852.1 Gfo/Idh/MocA family oxidoreductase [Ignavibacteria bacterium]
MTILICGLGSIGKRHLKLLRKAGVDKIIALRSLRNEKNNDPDVFADLEITDLKEIEGQKIDGAVVSNPTSLHIETSTELALKGIPLLIEKPLGKDLKGSDELQRIVKEKNLPVLMGYNLLYHPGIAGMKKLSEEGKIGKIISAKAQFGTFMPGWHKDEDYKKSYAANSSMGGGVVLTSIHEQNYLSDMFGEITDVLAMEAGGNVTDIDSEEAVEILMRHSSGVVSNIHLNFFQKPYYRNCQIIGTEGTLYWDFMIPEIKILYKDKTEIIKLGEDPMELLGISYQKQTEHFLDIIRNKTSPRAGLDTGIKDMKTALKILKDIGRN